MQLYTRPHWIKPDWVPRISENFGQWHNWERQTECRCWIQLMTRLGQVVWARGDNIECCWLDQFQSNFRYIVNTETVLVAMLDAQMNDPQQEKNHLLWILGFLHTSTTHGAHFNQRRTLPLVCQYERRISWPKGWRPLICETVSIILTCCCRIKTYYLFPGNAAVASVGLLESTPLLDVAQSWAVRDFSMLPRGWDLAYWPDPSPASHSAPACPQECSPLAFPCPITPPTTLRPSHQPSSASTDLPSTATIEAGCDLNGLVHLHTTAWLAPE